ncbi:hypothetical protein AX774_g8103 [Zancudomyces culisetae]|uniref:Uncharacterized protein n=1 Tax=Zancudomyces culisetae TaxID=1213189 RepID=A0A1R1PC07_ZANCU|nr:hypothetical protein AX774_g8103 [Zancudomyces culisetae]|eukprot:OMH78507.1 hypothetical protein AX774_g8103 [Zancudomyces culisetae]
MDENSQVTPYSKLHNKMKSEVIKKSNFETPITKILASTDTKKFDKSVSMNPNDGLDILLNAKSEQLATSKMHNYKSENESLRTKITKLKDELKEKNQYIDTITKKYKATQQELDTTKNKLQEMIENRVPLEDFTDVCKANKVLQEKLDEKDALLKECEEVLAEYAAAEEV